MVGAIGRKVKPPIRREDDTSCTCRGVRRDVLTTDRLERPRSRTTSGATFHFRKRAARSAMIMYDAVLDLVRLHVEVSAIRRAHLLGPHLFRPHLCRHIRFSCLHLPLDCPVLVPPTRFPTTDSLTDRHPTTPGFVRLQDEQTIRPIRAVRHPKPAHK